MLKQQLTGPAPASCSQATTKARKKKGPVSSDWAFLLCGIDGLDTAERADSSKNLQSSCTKSKAYTQKNCLLGRQFDLKFLEVETRHLNRFENSSHMSSFK